MSKEAQDQTNRNALRANVERGKKTAEDYMRESATPQPERWVVDEQPDANGNSTIRIDDGSLNGDTTQQPIATVYSPDAELIAAAPQTAEKLAAIEQFFNEERQMIEMKDALLVTVAKENDRLKRALEGIQKSMRETLGMIKNGEIPGGNEFTMMDAALKCEAALEDATPAQTKSDPLESQEFEDIARRACRDAEDDGSIIAFEPVKEFIRENFVAK